MFSMFDQRTATKMHCCLLFSTASRVIGITQISPKLGVISFARETFEDAIALEDRRPSVRKLLKRSPQQYHPKEG